jgi:hypothetical protein
MVEWFRKFYIIAAVLKASTHLEAMGRVGRALADETAAGPALWP